MDGADHRPFGLHLLDSPQEELAEPSRLLDLSEYRLDHLLAQAVAAALARLFALDPEIMLMDEPFGSLDAQIRELLQEELQSIWRRPTQDRLFVTHTISMNRSISRRALLCSRPVRGTSKPTF